LDKEGDYVTRQTPCPFLAEDNTCNIYEDRPSDCRRYPYTDEDVLLKRIPLTLKNVTVCPATFMVMEQLLIMNP
jgi:Fe-S-cluster containining protein